MMRRASARLLAMLTAYHDELRLYEEVWATVRVRVVGPAAAVGPAAPGSAAIPLGPVFRWDLATRTFHGVPADFDAAALVAAMRAAMPAMLDAARKRVQARAGALRARLKAAASRPPKGSGVGLDGGPEREAEGRAPSSASSVDEELRSWMRGGYR